MEKGAEEGDVLAAKTSTSQCSSSPLTSGELAAIEDEELLNKMLDKAVDFEERRMIRAALRELLKKKRVKREQERGSRQQDLKQQGLSRGGATATGINIGSVNYQQKSHKGSAPGQLSASPSSPFPKKAASTPNASVALAVRCPVPASNTKNVKQMLLDWCRAKTEPYEGVNIKNFSSSWSDGIAFCALVHRFFPDAFEYSILNPNKRRENFELAFSTAERLADCAPLLDVDDLLRMDEPDWKCVYTYIQEFYRCLVEKGLVKTKKKL